LILNARDILNHVLWTTAGAIHLHAMTAIRASILEMVPCVKIALRAFLQRPQVSDKSNRLDNYPYVVESCAGSPLCSACPAGKKNEVNASVSCDLCETGKVSPPGSSACYDCQPGTIPSTDNSACSKCPPGSFSR
jgi:hypothetical protein